MGVQSLNPQRKSWTLEDLDALSSDLRALSEEPCSSSRALIALNELFVAVEGYFRSRGLQLEAGGGWSRRHWSYGLLGKLSKEIQSCKDAEAGITRPLLRFIDEQLMPRLYQEAQRLN